MRSYVLEDVNILVVERHGLLRKMLKTMFVSFNAPNVETCNDVDIAMEILADYDADIVLCDWSIGLDGMEFVRRVRKDRNSPNPFLPIIVISANTEYRHICQARDEGMTEFLAKPLSARQVYARICSVIENNRPFIKTLDFFGPCRRRHREADNFNGQEKRSEGSIANNGGLTPSQVQALLATG